MIEEKYKVIRLPARYGLKHFLKLLDSSNNLIYKLELDPEGGNYYRTISSPILQWNPSKTRLKMV